MTCDCMFYDDSDFVVCTMDMCWDGSSRDPTDCSCPIDYYGEKVDNYKAQCEAGFSIND